MEEFSEIEPGGFKIEFTPRYNGSCVVSMEPSALTGPMIPGRTVRTVGAVVNAAGFVLEMDSTYNSPNLRTLATYLVSDYEGLFGRICPSCKSYFRTNCVSKKKLICPYCSCKEDIGLFTTDNQKKFMSFCCQAALEAMTKGKKTTFDTGEVVKQLPSNRPQWVYTEQNQQRTYHCNKCIAFGEKIIFNILGDFGSCPSCGKRNYSEVFELKMKLLEQQFSDKDKALKEPFIRSEEWKRLLSDCVSQFESLANDICRQLLRIPTTPKRRSDLKRLSFQRIINANERLNEWFGIRILEKFSEADIVFLNRMFNRRHLVIHTGNRVDEEYIKNTGDTTVSLNQTIRISSNEISRLIGLTTWAGINLIADYDSIV